MNKFPTNDSKQTFSKTEEAILKFWQENNIFEQTIESRHPNNEYVFFDGPPFATGLPHYGHILAGTIKDAIPRYMTMKGYRVNRKFGWDCHGVPVEFLIEKEHKIGGKPGIEKMGTATFNDLCQSAVMRCADDWRSSVARMGRFVDFENDYKTMDPEFMESVWSVFKELWDKNLIYEGEKVVAYSPKLGSPLSNFEAGQNYKDIDDPAITVKFPVLFESTQNSASNSPLTTLQESGIPINFLAWTTTPWTMPSHTALCVNEKLNYCVVAYENENYIVGEKLVEKFFGENAEILKTISGKDLVGISYEPPFQFFAKIREHGAYQVLSDNFVAEDSGTGIVHLAPTGEDDARILQTKRIPLIYPFDDNCYFDFTDVEPKYINEKETENLAELAGKYFRFDPEINNTKDDNANIWVLDQLKNSGKLFKREQIRHSYPHCWRTDSALMYRGIKTWFVDVQAIKDKMIAKNKKINWIPDHLRDGRFGKILETAPDWAISRNRYWGAPIPVWRCENEACKHIEVVSTREELEAKTGKKVKDIHKQYVDDLTWECTKCATDNALDSAQAPQIPEELDQYLQNIDKVLKTVNKENFRDLKLTIPVGRIPEKATEKLKLADSEIFLSSFIYAKIKGWTNKNEGHDEITNLEYFLIPFLLADPTIILEDKKHNLRFLVCESEKRTLLLVISSEKGRNEIVSYFYSHQGKMKDRTIIYKNEEGRPRGIPSWIHDKVTSLVRRLSQDEKFSSRPILNYDNFIELLQESQDEQVSTGSTSSSSAFDSVQAPQMRRIPEVLDCWFESGAMPYASRGVHFQKMEENKEEIKLKNLGENSLEGLNKTLKTQIQNVYDIITEVTEENFWKDDKKRVVGTLPKQVAEKLDIHQDIYLSNKLYAKIRNWWTERHGHSDITESDFFFLPALLTHPAIALIDTKSNDRVVILNNDEKSFVIVLDDTNGYTEVLSFFVIRKKGDSNEYLKNKKRFKKMTLEGLPVPSCISVALREELRRLVGRFPSRQGHICTDIIKFFIENQILNQKIGVPVSTGSTSNVPIQADFIAEGLDQTRGWFYTLHVLGCALTGENIYKNVITNGIVLAEDGQKMSKSKKNYPDPNLIFDKYGADAMRYYLLSSPAVRGENLRFMEKGVEEILKTILIPIKNAYQFFSLYANIDNWNPTKLTAIRHGEGDHNVQNIYSGKAENPHHLTIIGKQQVAEQAKNLAKFDVLIASPFIRTQETAQIIKDETNYNGEILTDELIRESSFGELEGQKLIPHGGRLDNKTTEPIESIFERWSKFVTKISRDFRGQHICAVTHGDGLRALNGILGNNTPTKDNFLLIPMSKTAEFRTFVLPPQTENELDLWILSELQTLITKFRENFDAYNLEVALREIPNFVDNLNNWYLRRNRKRFWRTGLDDDKKSGYETLHHVLLNLAQLLAPVCPFFAEKLFQDLMQDQTNSVHLTLLPFANKKLINTKLEQKIKNSREIVQLSAAIRARQKIKLRQPLAKLKFITTQKIDLDLDIIAQEANVEEVEVLTSIEGIADQIIKVDARKVGRKFGKKTQELIKAGKSGDFKMQASGQVDICGEILEADEYEIGFNTQEGVEAEATREVVVLLETEISPELEIKGFTREIIRAIQEKRKSSGFEIENRIEVNYATKSEILIKAFEQYAENISQEVLAEKIEKSENLETDELNLDGEKIKLALKKV